MAEIIPASPPAKRMRPISLGDVIDGDVLLLAKDASGDSDDPGCQGVSPRSNRRNTKSVELTGGGPVECLWSKAKAARRLTCSEKDAGRNRVVHRRRQTAHIETWHVSH
jgi:hypothetical protein